MAIHVTPINTFHEKMDPTVVNIIIDDSYSMTPMRKEGIVALSINEIMIPGMREAHKTAKSLLRVALGAFSDDKIQSLTKKPGYFAINELIKQPIANNRFGGPGLNGNTALYASMIDAIDSSEAAALIVKKQLGCRQVKARVIVLTDGENFTEDTTTATDVRNALKDVDGGVKMNLHLAYFKTNTSMTRKSFLKVATDCGIDHKNCHFWADHGTDLAAQKKAFRSLIQVLSRLT